MGVVPHESEAHGRFGLAMLPSIDDIPERVDLAVISRRQLELFLES